MEEKFGISLKNAFFELRESEDGDTELWVVENLKDGEVEHRWLDIVAKIDGREELTININHTNKN
ncbi:hypothetical protein [Clostridium sp.]|uniref:hypothetical protein n=1 Tax=Clostridium sp. TaxID=1506 RepID=UPI003F2B803F